ncbi:MAG TPA: uracil-DNA glycosylase [Desulfobacterales bacterium]|nr:uracil-DNA glycosylase [Desulfobacterales bacterium]
MRPKSDTNKGTSYIICRACKHFFITHQPSFPYGCRALGFKSARLPFKVVVECSDLPCQAFQKRE